MARYRLKHLQTPILLLVGCVALNGCSARISMDMVTNEAIARGLTSLADAPLFPDRVCEARDTLIADMRRRGEEPSEYYASHEIQGDSMVVFHLWHRSALGPSTRAVNAKPGSRNYDAYFDRAQRRITRRHSWQ